MWPKSPTIPYVIFFLSKWVISHVDDNKNDDNSNSNNNNDGNKLNSKDKKIQGLNAILKADIWWNVAWSRLSVILEYRAMMEWRLVGKNRTNSDETLLTYHFINTTFYIKLAGRFSGKVSSYVMTVITSVSINAAAAVITSGNNSDTRVVILQR